MPITSMTSRPRSTTIKIVAANGALCFEDLSLSDMAHWYPLRAR
jgi:hypothetical protein